MAPLKQKTKGRIKVFNTEKTTQEQKDTTTITNKKIDKGNFW